MKLLIFHYRIPQCVLDETRAFLFEKGLDGCEGTGLWIGKVNGTHVDITRFFAPEQICIKTEYGVAVDLTQRAHFTLTDNLNPGERFFVRIHSHPDEAYHSDRDNKNQILTHQGAISIVVPDFAAKPIDLSHCAVYRLEHGRGWIPITTEEIRTTFEIVS